MRARTPEREVILDVLVAILEVLVAILEVLFATDPERELRVHESERKSTERPLSIPERERRFAFVRERLLLVRSRAPESEVIEFSVLRILPESESIAHSLARILPEKTLILFSVAAILPERERISPVALERKLLVARRLLLVVLRLPESVLSAVFVLARFPERERFTHSIERIRPERAVTIPERAFCDRISVK